MSEQQLAEIRSVDVLALVGERAAGQVSGYLAVLLAEVERLRGALSEATDTVAELESDIGGWSARVAELESGAAKVADFVAARAEYITAIESCHPDNARDYHRWQGHAESRRQLAEKLGLPVAWPAEAGDGS